MLDDINLDNEILMLEETTVARISGERVGCGNIGSYEFENEDGTSTKEMGIMLSRASTGERLTVKVGDELEFGGEQWKLIAIHERKEGQLRGEAVLEKQN